MAGFINMDRKYKKAFIGDVAVDTKEAVRIFSEGDIDTYFVGWTDNKNHTIFQMKRGADGVWNARYMGEEYTSFPKMERVLGKGQEISYDKLEKTWDDIIRERDGHFSNPRVKCIHMNPDEKKAWINDYELGTEEAAKILAEDSVSECTVELDWQYEMTYFLMKRRPDGVWVARWAGEKDEPKMERVLGNGKEITFDRIHKIWHEFLKERDEKKRGQVAPGDIF